MRVSRESFTSDLVNFSLRSVMSLSYFAAESAVHVVPVACHSSNLDLMEPCMPSCESKPTVEHLHVPSRLICQVT